MNLRSQAQRIARDVAFVRDRLGELDEDAVFDLLRRAQYSTKPDGYPESTRPTEIHGQGSDDPLVGIADARIRHDRIRQLVEDRRAAVAASDHRAVRACDQELKRLGAGEGDPLRANIEEIFASISEISGHAKRVHRLRQVVLHAGDKLKGRQTTLSQCQACNRDVSNVGDDRLRSGYCDACRKAWDREPQPRDRLRFELRRRQELAAAAQGEPTRDLVQDRPADDQVAAMRSAGALPAPSSS